jgi:hypothetical protein
MKIINKNNNIIYILEYQKTFATKIMIIGVLVLRTFNENKKRKKFISNRIMLEVYLIVIEANI